jgi:hypothetical protein
MSNGLAYKEDGKSWGNPLGSFQHSRNVPASLCHCYDQHNAEKESDDAELEQGGIACIHHACVLGSNMKSPLNILKASDAVPVPYPCALRGSSNAAKNSPKDSHELETPIRFWGCRSPRSLGRKQTVTQQLLEMR